MRLRLPLAQRLRPSELQATLFWAGLVGFLGAGAAALFRGLSLAAQELFWRHSGDLVESAAGIPIWMRILVPVAGGLAAGLVIQLGVRFAALDIERIVVMRDVRFDRSGRSVVSAASPDDEDRAQHHHTHGYCAYHGLLPARRQLTDPERRAAHQRPVATQAYAPAWGLL